MKHSDFHKIGKLLLNNGKYQGIQIVPEVWIKEMCKLQFETPSAHKKKEFYLKLV